jgi:RecB family exonuclease
MTRAPSSIVVSPSAATRLEEARSWLSQFPSTHRLLVVGPSELAALELMRRMTVEKGALFGWERTTLARLTATLGETERLERRLTRLGTLSSEALAARAVHSSRPQDLGHFHPIARRPGFVTALSRTLNELRLAQKTPRETRKVNDVLGGLLARYERLQLAHRHADRAELFEVALRALHHDKVPAPPAGCPLLLLDVEVHTRAAQKLVEALGEVASSVLATVPAGDRRSLEAIEQALGVTAESLTPAPPLSSSAAVQCHLFEPTRPDRPGADDSFALFSAPGEARECAEIARRVRTEAARGVPLDQMAVLLRAPDEYRAHLEEAFDRAGIPAYFALGVERPDPAGRAFMALLRCAEENLSARGFAEYLSLGELPDAEEGGAPPAAPPPGDRWRAPVDELLAVALAETAPEEPVRERNERDVERRPVSSGTLRAPRRWERLICNAAVVGESARWKRRLAGLEKELRLKHRELLDEGEDTSHVERDLEDLAALRDFVLPLTEALDQLPTEASWGTWQEHLSGLATRALRQPERVLETLSELSPMAPVDGVSLDEVLQVLKPHLITLGRQPAETRYGRVLVAPIELARGLSFEVVFVPGLAERLFPKKIATDPLLPERDRETLSDLLLRADRVQQEQLALRLAVGAGSRLHVSYPRVDSATGRQRVASFYALELLRPTCAKLPGYEELLKLVDPCQSRLGWPAPKDPEQAIDLIEHDLALVARASGGDTTLRQQTIAHLLRRHLIRRSLLHRARRWSRKWTVTDGLVATTAEGLEAIRKHRPGERAYSATGLEALARCPFRFYLKAIARLREREAPDWLDELDAMQRGALVHDVQYELFQALESDGLLPVRPENLDRVQSALDATLNVVAARYREDLAPAIERVWQDGIERIRGDLREWLRRMAVDDGGWKPWRFEHGFGLEGEDAVNLGCGIRLRGRIDLVETGPGQSLRVTDYKTGKARGGAGLVIKGGTVLQPVLYGLAARVLFPGRTVAAGRLDYCTSTGGFTAREVALDEEAEQAATELAQTLDGYIEQGFLPASPDDLGCDYCDYKIVCGTSAGVRSERKDPGRLAALIALRDWS